MMLRCIEYFKGGLKRIIWWHSRLLKTPIRDNYSLCLKSTIYLSLIYNEVSDLFAGVHWSLSICAEATNPWNRDKKIIRAFW